jgi:nitrogen fixation protein NifU and related proteins
MCVVVPVRRSGLRGLLVSDLRELYQEVILDHNRRPRNFRAIEDANRHAEGYNPLCGDRLSLYLKVEDGVIKDASFQGSGCAISKASASMMTDSVKGKTVTEVHGMFEQFHQMVTGNADPLTHPEQLGKLAVFEGVRQFPARVKCASLAWHALRSAVDAKDEVVSTEVE